VSPIQPLLGNYQWRHLYLLPSTSASNHCRDSLPPCVYRDSGARQTRGAAFTFSHRHATRDAVFTFPPINKRLEPLSRLSTAMRLWRQRGKTIEGEKEEASPLVKWLNSQEIGGGALDPELSLVPREKRRKRSGSQVEFSSVLVVCK
jgi:hypothetical protein